VTRRDVIVDSQLDTQTHTHTHTHHTVHGAHVTISQPINYTDADGAVSFRL